MTALRSLAFNLFFLFFSLVLAIAYLPLLLLPRRFLWAGARFWIRTLFAALRLLCGLGSRFEGREHLPPGAGIVAAKHQSAWDTLVFLLLLEAPVMVLKRELLRVPLFGWYLQRLGMIAVDRGGGTAALQGLLRQARQRAAEGRPIVIFPEGTRTDPGSSRRYQPGVAALYRDLGLPVVPVALNSGRYWGRRAFSKRPGTILLKALPPIPPGLERADFMRRLQAAVDGESARLDGTGPADDRRHEPPPAGPPR